MGCAGAIGKSFCAHQLLRVVGLVQLVHHCLVVLVAFLFQDTLSDGNFRKVGIASLICVEGSTLFTMRVARRDFAR